MYSTPAEIKAFEESLGGGPILMINDMDGNILDGFLLVPGQPAFHLGPDGDPKTQSIPFGTSPEKLDLLVRAGILSRGIFAEKGMDVRLPVPLVQMLNRQIENQDRFSFAILTSRFADAAIKVLEESGVKNPQAVTMVADSGATLFINGEKIVVRKLSRAEAAFLKSIDDDVSDLTAIVRAELVSLGLDPDLSPSLYIEHKAIGTNVHYREILTAYKQPEGSDLDQMLREAIKSFLQKKVGAGAVDNFGDPVFKTLNGPATVEVKVAKINKGHGLEALAHQAMASATPPKAIIFTGDDIAPDGKPGTDYYAAVRAASLSQEIGIPVYVVHTHHPEGGMSGTYPDPKKAVEALDPEYAQPEIDLTLRTPQDTAALNERIGRRNAAGYIRTFAAAAGQSEAGPVFE